MPTTSTNPPTKDGVVYVVDDDEAMRDSLAWLLQANGYKSSCHESGERFLQALSATDNSTIACALLDIRMPNMTGMELHEKLLAKGYDFPVSFITGHGEISQAVQALKLGAIDFIQKPFKEDLLCELVEKMLSKAFKDKKDFLDLDAIKTKFATLTPREIHVLDRIAIGMTNKEVSADLDISVKTVEAHRANIMDKLQVNRPAKLLQIVIKYQDALKQGLVEA
jgi:FixJ family two-component response regulator